LKKILLALTLAAVLATSATAAAATSPSAYRAKVNGICAAGVATIRALPAPKTAAGLLPYFQQVSKLGDRLLLKIIAVTPPVKLQPSIGHAIDLQVSVQKLLHQLIAKLKTSKNPKQTVAAAEAKINGINDKANAAWRAAGLVKCAG
jgi:hypothetical protein